MVTLNAVLARLRLKNIGLIDSLELSFEKGFTVFTGETGAGKSIFLDAIDLLLGGTQVSNSSRLMKIGSESCFIEGCFQKNSFSSQWLKDNNFDFDGNEFAISREWKFSDDKWKSRSKLNGRNISKQNILKLKPMLVDLTVQSHANELNSLSSQLKWIDRLGLQETEDLLFQVKNSWIKWKLALQTFEKAKLEYDERKSNFKDMSEMLEALEIANINDPNEEKSLDQEEGRLVYGVRLQESLQLLFANLRDSLDEFPTALDTLSICVKELKTISELDKTLKPQLDKALDLYSELEQLIGDLDNYHLLLESDPNQLEVVQERRSFLKTLQTRYKLDLGQLITQRDKLREELNSQDPLISIDSLKQKESLALDQRDKCNYELSAIRKKVASNVEIILMKHLKTLGLANASCKVQLIPSLACEHGADEVNFLFSANPGQPLLPLSEIASGGEMSRFLLALKAILADVDGSSTLIFDEIDTGVSGRVSSSIANVLRDLSKSRQVFCVTHQPLVAALADHHFSISKVSLNGSTTSKVIELKGFEERQRELAELAGGDFAEASIYVGSLLENKAA